MVHQINFLRKPDFIIQILQYPCHTVIKEIIML